MTSIRQIAENPRKALTDLEKELGAKPGALLGHMDQLAGKGDDWRTHLPYGIAASYYEDESARVQYQSHVDGCEYCKTLLQTLHPSDFQARDFAHKAKRLHQPAMRRSLPAYWVPLAAAASVAVSFVAIPQLQRGGYLPSAVRETQLVVKNLSLEPSALSKLETSLDPTERYRAARYYFAMEQPQLAYRQIGEGLELSGLGATDAMKITTAADLPREQSAPALAQAARRLDALKAAPSNGDPAHYLEVATTEAKLGMHEQSLKSIQKYLEAKKADPAIVAKFSESALANSATLVAVSE